MRANRRLRALGAVKAGGLTTAVAAVTVVLGGASAAAMAAQSGSHASSRPTLRSHIAATVVRGSRLLVNDGQIVRPTGSTVVVHGYLRPAREGEPVKLLRRADHRWHTLAVAHTLRTGRFGLRFRIQEIGATEVRVAYAGNRDARPAAAPAGRIVGLARFVASWYYDAGDTACGFHATYGVANKTLPCGTKVTISYDDRTVVATVDDRGPYVYGRTFDLNQNTARYLGMWGVAQVYASF